MMSEPSLAWSQKLAVQHCTLEVHILFTKTTKFTPVFRWLLVIKQVIGLVRVWINRFQPAWEVREFLLPPSCLAHLFWGSLLVSLLVITPARSSGTLFYVCPLHVWWISTRGPILLSLSGTDPPNGDCIGAN